MSALWYLSTPSFGGIVAGASHYYCHLRAGGIGKIDVGYLLTEEQARALDRGDGFTHRAGESCGRWFTKDLAVNAGVAAFGILADAGDALVHGEWASAEPAQPLAGPDSFVVPCRDLVARSEAADWWEGDQAAMKTICREWDALLEAHGFERGTYQHNPDSRSVNLIGDPPRIATEDEEDAWMDEAYPEPVSGLVAPPSRFGDGADG